METLSDFETILGMIHNAEIVEALVIIIILVFIGIASMRFLIPMLLQTRTKIQQELETTYNEHVAELKDMVAEQKELVEAQKIEREDTADRITKQGKQLRAMNARLVMIIRMLQKYNCKRAADCENREEIGEELQNLVLHPVCDTCELDNCFDCPYAYELEKVINVEDVHSGSGSTRT